MLCQISTPASATLIEHAREKRPHEWRPVAAACRLPVTVRWEGGATFRTGRPQEDDGAETMGRPPPWPVRQAVSEFWLAKAAQDLREVMKGHSVTRYASLLAF